MRSLIITLPEAKAAVDNNNADAVQILSFKDLFVIVLFLMFVVGDGGASIAKREFQRDFSELYGKKAGGRYFWQFHPRGKYQHRSIWFESGREN